MYFYAQTTKSTEMGFHKIMQLPRKYYWYELWNLETSVVYSGHGETINHTKTWLAFLTLEKLFMQSRNSQ